MENKALLQARWLIVHNQVRERKETTRERERGGKRESERER